MELAGKTALITGGGGGIGAGMAEAFIEKGMKVVITDVNADYARAEAERIGGDILALAHDVTSQESWTQVKQAAEARFGPVDILCNNAGIAQPFKLLDEIEPAQFGRLIAVNVTGVYLGVHAFTPAMRARKSGHIVNTSSLNGLLPHATFAAYTASKFAVAGMSEALRAELEPFGIGVSILYPGLTRSRMSEGQVGETMRAQMMEPIWLGRAVARAVEQNQTHIITHPAHFANIEARFTALREAHGEPAQPGYGSA